MGWFSWRRNRELDLQRELNAHLELETEEQAEAGKDDKEAHLAARRLLGNMTSAQEATREAWGWGWLDRFVQDVSYGFRSFGKTPGFTSVVVLTLALGIGATSAIFSIFSAVILQPLPYYKPERLTVTWLHPEHNALVKEFDSYRDFEAWKNRTHSFQQLAVATWATGQEILSVGGKTEEVLAMPVSAGFFSMLGVPPVLGRTFQERDVHGGCSIVLRHSFWSKDLAGDPKIIGKSVRLNNRSCVVLGVMPSDFTFYPDVVPMWRLIGADDEIVRNPANSMVGVFGRLKPDVSLEDAQKEVRAIYSSLHAHDRQDDKPIPAVYPLQEEFTFLSGATLRLSLVVLFVAVLLVLLIACVNVTNLLLGRSLGRKKEFAVRCALGAGRFRLARQLLTEGLLLSFSGALLGVGLAAGAVHLFRLLRPIPLPPGTVVSMNLQVLAFAVGLAVLTALLFSSAPAWRASQVDLNESLKAAGRNASTGLAARAAAKILIVAEVALSLILLAGAGLLIKSVALFASTPLGFSTKDVLSLTIVLPSWRYARPEQRGRFYERVLKNVQSLPGIHGLAFTTFFPLAGGGQSETFEIDGHSSAGHLNELNTLHQAITPSYLRLMGTPLLRGRNFDDRDRQGSEPVAMINQELAKKYFSHASPIGSRVRLKGSQGETRWVTIVGVVGNEKNFDFFQEMSWAVSPMIFRPLSQAEPFRASILIRSFTAPERLELAVRKQILTLDSDIPLGDPQTLQQRFSKVLAYPRFRALLLGAFAGLALLLACVGLYGVLAQFVAQRTQEIGIRMALGAQKTDVLLLILREGITLVAFGMAGGLLSAWFLQRLIRSLLYRHEMNDIATLMVVSGLLLVSALLAVYIPARRATRLSPTVTLRYE